MIFCLFDVPETPRTVGLSSHRGMITSAYTVMECSDLSTARFLEYFYLAMDERKRLSPLYSGLRNTIPPSRFLAAKTPMPPPMEMKAIVDLLDSRLADIDRFIANKRRLIDLLGEEFQRDVDRVTRNGISDCKTRDSGIDWIGSVPCHWQIAPLKYAFSSMDYGISDSGTDEGTIPVLTMGDIRSGPDRRRRRTTGAGNRTAQRYRQAVQRTVGQHPVGRQGPHYPRHHGRTAREGERRRSV